MQFAIFALGTGLPCPGTAQEEQNLCPYLFQLCRSLEKPAPFYLVMRPHQTNNCLGVILVSEKKKWNVKRKEKKKKSIKAKD